jgi:hypothetical protein
VTLSLAAVDFMRLGCGRITSAQVEAAGGVDTGGVDIDGDHLVGRSVLGAMNFMP